MEIKKEPVVVDGVRLILYSGEKPVARAFLYIMKNDLHEKPFGLMEDVWVDDALRGQGFGTKIVEELIKEAKARGCYKLIATSRRSRDKVHKLYERLGFTSWGYEFRMNFD